MSEFNNQGDNSTGGIPNLLKKWRSGIFKTAQNRPVPGNVTAKISEPQINSGVSPAKATSSSSINLPTNSLSKTIATSSDRTQKQQDRIPPYKIKQFDTILQADNVDVKALRELAWNGVPSQYRTMVWQILLGLIFFLFITIILVRKQQLTKQDIFQQIKVEEKIQLRKNEKRLEL